MIVPLLLPPLVPRLTGVSTRTVYGWASSCPSVGQLFADRNCHSGRGVAGVSVEVPVTTLFSSGSLPGRLLL